MSITKQKTSKFNNEANETFSFRKYKALGLCSVALAMTFVLGNSQEVKADTVNDNTATNAINNDSSKPDDSVDSQQSKPAQVVQHVDVQNNTESKTTNSQNTNNNTDQNASASSIASGNSKQTIANQNSQTPATLDKTIASGTANDKMAQKQNNQTANYQVPAVSSNLEATNNDSSGSNKQELQVSMTNSIANSNLGMFAESKVVATTSKQLDKSSTYTNDNYTVHASGTIESTLSGNHVTRKINWNASDLWSAESSVQDWTTEGSWTAGQWTNIPSGLTNDDLNKLWQQEGYAFRETDYQKGNASWFGKFSDIPIKVKQSVTMQNLSIGFVDTEHNNNVVGTPFVVSGKVGDSHTFNESEKQKLQIPQGYMLAQGQTVPTSVQFKNSTDPLAIKLVAAYGPVTPGKDLDGTKPEDYNYDVERQVTIIGDPGQNEQGIKYPHEYTRQDTVHFMRDGQKDLVNGSIKWGAWYPTDANGKRLVDESGAATITVNSFGKFQIDDRPGYSTNFEGIANSLTGITVTGDPANAVVTADGGLTATKDESTGLLSFSGGKITYVASPQSVTYNFVDTEYKDDTGKTDPHHIVKSVTEHGVTDQNLKLTDLALPDNYDLADGASIPTDYTFKASSNDPIEIKLKHHIIATPDMEQSDPDNENKPLSELTDVKRTYTFVAKAPDKYLSPSKAKVVWNLHFHRSVTQDAVTKKFSYGKWQLDGNSQYDADDNSVINTPSMSAFMEYTTEPDAHNIVGYIPHLSQNFDVPVSNPESLDFDSTETDNADHTMVHFTLDVDDPLTLPDNLTQTVEWTPGRQTAQFKYFDQDKNNSELTSQARKIYSATDTTPIYDMPVPDGYAIDHIIMNKDGKDVNLGNTLPKLDYTTTNVNGVWQANMPTYSVYLTHNINSAKPGEHGLTDHDFKRHIERDITITDPDGVSKTQKQEVTFTRTGTWDEVNQAVTWQPWSENGKHTFEAITIPAISGYQASGSVTSQEVTPDSNPNTSLSITYKAIGQSVAVNYTDPGTGSVIKTRQIQGQTGTTVSLGLEQYVPENWQLANKFQPDQYTFTSDKDQAVTVNIEHVLVPQADDTKTITRTINITLPDGTKDPHSTVQSATFTRSCNFDKVLGHNVYGDWSANQQFKGIDLPDINGYDTPQIAEITVTPESTSSTLNLTYTARGQNANIYYVDSNDINNRIGTQTISGKTGKTLDINYDVPENWHIIGQAPKQYSFSADHNEPITVKIAHNLIDQGTDTKTITRVVTITDPDGKVTATSQTHDFTRNKQYDEVDKKIIYGDWSDNGKYVFSKVTPKAITGYVINGSAPEITVTPDSNSDDLATKITYVAGGQTGSYVFIDDDNNEQQVGENNQIAGKTGQTIQLDLKAPTNYIFDPNKTVPSEYTFKADHNNPIKVYLKHKTIDASQDKDAEVERDFTRNINITKPDGKAVNAQQIIKFHRTATKDLITGKITYGNWSDNGKGQFDAYPIPAVAGYDALNKETGKAITEIAKAAINADDKDQQTQNVDIIYKAQNRSAYWQFIDDDADKDTPNLDAIQSRHNISGTVDQKIKLNIVLPQNYHVARIEYTGDAKNASDTNSTEIPDSYTFTSDKVNKNLIIHLRHNTQVKSSANGDKGLDDNRTITRTITITAPHSKDTVEKQSVKFTRSATKDMVTGQITYGAWSNGGKQTLDAINLPNIPGYSPDAKIDSIIVTPDTKPIATTINFVATDNHATINYADKTGKIIHTQTVKGKTDQKVPVIAEVPDGWVGEVPKEITINPVDKPITVTVDHLHVTVSKDHPGNPGNIMPGTKQIKYPDGTGINDLTKEVTRTITINVPGSEPRVIKQTVNFDRTADIDAVTGQVTYQAWTPDGKDKFDKVTVPTIDGYKPNITEIHGVDPVPSDWSDDHSGNITITYTKSDVQGQQTVAYINSITGKTVSTQIVKGIVGKATEFIPQIPKGYSNKNLPKTLVIPELDKPISFKVTPDDYEVKIDPDHPLKPGDKIPGTNIPAPKGLDYDDLHKSITRTIDITDPITGKESTIVQSVKAKRGASINVVNLKITYDPWQIDGKDGFDKVDIPQIRDYQSNPKSIPAVPHVDPNKTYNTVIHVTYTKIATKPKPTKPKTTKPKVTDTGLTATSDNNSQINPEIFDTINANGKFSGIDQNLLDSLNTKFKDINFRIKLAAQIRQKLNASFKLAQYNRRNSNYNKYGNRQSGYGNKSLADNNRGIGNSNSNLTGSNQYGNNAFNNSNAFAANNAINANSLNNSQSKLQGKLPQTSSANDYGLLAMGIALISTSFALAGVNKRKKQ